MEIAATEKRIDELTAQMEKLKKNLSAMSKTEKKPPIVPKVLSFSGTPKKMLAINTVSEEKLKLTNKPVSMNYEKLAYFERAKTDARTFIKLLERQLTGLQVLVLQWIGIFINRLGPIEAD